MHRGVTGVGKDLCVDGGNIKGDLEKTRWDGVDVIRQIQDRDKLLLWTRLWEFDLCRICVLY